MATKLQQQIADGVRAELAKLGIVMPAPRGERAAQTDHLAFGSDEHRQFLGLVVVAEGDDVTGYTTFKSKGSGKTYRLANELEAVRHYPGMSPAQSAVLLLRSKINSLESEHPKAPANAPRMWSPSDAGPRATLALVQGV